MIFSKDYFVKGEVAGKLAITARDYFGKVEDVRSFVGELEGTYVLTLAWERGRESKTYKDFATAVKMSNGYWARQSIWHITPDGKRRRVIKWQ
jgi:hypothetical protein